MSGKRLVIFDAVPNKSKAVRDYEIMRDLRAAPAEDLQYLRNRSPSMAELPLPCPLRDRRGRSPALVRFRKKGVASGYDMFDYVLRHADGRDVEGAEDVAVANWAGWHHDGRLVVAAGRYITFYDVRPGKPLQKPVKTIDIEAAIA